MSDATWYVVMTRALKLLGWRRLPLQPDGDLCLWSSRGNGWLKPVRILFVVVSVAFAALVCGSEARGQVVDSSTIRAGHIFNFGKFVEWPA